MKNSFYLLLSNNIERILGLIFFSVIVDKLSIEEFGCFKYFISISTMCVFFASIGFDSAVLREIKDHINNIAIVNKFLTDYLKFKVKMSIVVILVFLFVYFFGFQFFIIERAQIVILMLLIIQGLIFRPLLETLLSINMNSFIVKNIDVLSNCVLVIYAFVQNKVVLNELLLVCIIKDYFFLFFLMYYNYRSKSESGFYYKFKNEVTTIDLFKQPSFKTLWLGNSFKDLSFKFLDSGFDILLIGYFMGYKEVAIYSFAITFASIPMNLNFFKLSRSFMNLWLFKITDSGTNKRLLNKILHIFGLLNQLNMFLIFIPFIIFTYFAINFYFVQYINSFSLIVILTFGYLGYSNYYTLSGFVFIFKDPMLFTKAGLIIGIVNFFFNFFAVSFFNIEIVAVSSALGLIITPIVMMTFINRKYYKSEIELKFKYLLSPIIVMFPLILLYFFVKTPIVSNLVLLIFIFINLVYLYYIIKNVFENKLIIKALLNDLKKY